MNSPSSETPATGAPSKQFRLVLSHPDWPTTARTKWQASRDFSRALKTAAELGVTAEIEEGDAQTIQQSTIAV